ncbi:AzlD domain-containing protein [Streptomyces sp. NPDC006367]|uniref:AzlD domain-containing protein n=1 Tax=Streptomyces sp. NPDC006367 TaxID=3156759 RepID=UPI0033B6AD3A
MLGSLIPDSVTGLDFAPTALFTVLALDAVRDLRGDAPTLVLAVLSALAVTVGLHLWHRDALPSILGGTATHVNLASTLFAR